MNNEPIFKITQIKLKKEDVSGFIKEQEAELENSIPAEEGTLLFGSAHMIDDDTDNYVFELYRNSKAYEAHSMANYFDHYDQVIKQMSQSEKVYDLKPEFITTKPKESLNSYANNFVMRMAKIEIEDNSYEQFSEDVKKEMSTAIAREPGVQILMAGSNIQNENEWFFVGVYSNDEAYDKHLQYPWFANYIKKSENIVKDRKVYELDRDVLASQGQIVLD